MTFQSWMQQRGLSEKSARNYAGAINGSISTWAIEAKIIAGPLLSIESSVRFEQISEEIQNLEIFQRRNTDGKKMYSSALNKFAEYLKANFEKDVEDDLSEILTEEQASETDRISAVKIRLGQGIFRQKLIGYWNGCAVTRYPDTALLVASHIKPWRDSSNEERLSVYNGLLLLPSLDKVFDKGLITFEESGKIKVSEQLEMPGLFGISDDMKVLLDKQHQDYLAFHREQVFCS